MGRAEQRSIVAKVRVYELAKEFGVESKVVMTKLEEVGEFVRSPSATMEERVVRNRKESLNSGSAKPGLGDGGAGSGGRRDQGGQGDSRRNDRGPSRDGAPVAGGSVSAAPSAPSAPAPSAGVPGARPGPPPGPSRSVPYPPSV